LALYRRQYQYRWLAMRSLLATVLSGGVGIGLALKGFGVWALISQYLCAATVNLLLLWIRPLWRPGIAVSWQGLSQLLRFSLKLLLSRLLEACNARAFELAIGAWMGAAMLGLYSVGSRVHQIVIQLLSSVVLDVGLSGFSRLADDKPRFTEAYYKAITATAALAMPVFVLLAAVAPEFCMMVFGRQWQASGSILHWLALLGAVQSIQYINGAAITALGRTDKTLLITCAKTAATLIVLFYYGHGELVELVKAFAYGQLLVSPLGFGLGKRQIGFNWRTLWLKLWPFPAAAGTAYLAVAWLRGYWLPENPWLELTILAAFGAAVYAMLSIALRFHAFVTTLRYLRQS
jgi:O-antigen/teichoic acid export membrane protein